MKSLLKDKIVRHFKGDLHAYNQMKERLLLISQAVSKIALTTTFLHHFEEDGVDYLIYELCKGGTLA